MHLEIFGSAAEASSAVARMIIAQLQRKPESVLGLPTGGSPLRVYEELRRAFAAREVSFAHASTFNLDEYVGVGADQPSSYAAYMRDALFDHVDCPPSECHIPNGAAADPDREVADYERKISASGGIDLLFLGIGRNGHIAFNEPGSSHSSRTRVIALSENTVEANARFFSTREQVPKQAITMGIGTILEARKIVLLATGADKAEALSQSFQHGESEQWPASALNAHPNCHVVADREAARLLESPPLSDPTFLQMGQ